MANAYFCNKLIKWALLWTIWTSFFPTLKQSDVLSKYQGRRICNKLRRGDLHTDETSNDNKKIIGQQINLDTGKTLSAGFYATKKLS